MKKPLKLLLISKVENGFRIVRGHDANNLIEEYAAESDETVLKLIREHLDSHAKVVSPDEIRGVAFQKERTL